MGTVLIIGLIIVFGIFLIIMISSNSTHVESNSINEDKHDFEYTESNELRGIEGLQIFLFDENFHSLPDEKFTFSGKGLYGENPDIYKKTLNIPILGLFDKIDILVFQNEKKRALLKANWRPNKFKKLNKAADAIIAIMGKDDNMNAHITVAEFKLINSPDSALFERNWTIDAEKGLFVNLTVIDKVITLQIPI